MKPTQWQMEAEVDRTNKALDNVLKEYAEKFIASRPELATASAPEQAAAFATQLRAGCHEAQNPPTVEAGICQCGHDYFAHGFNPDTRQRETCAACVHRIDGDNTCKQFTPELAAQKPPAAEPMTIYDYEEVLADHRRLVRELDVLINGEAGAAKQASLCDIVSQIKGMKRAASTAPGWIAPGEE